MFSNRTQEIGQALETPAEKAIAKAHAKAATRAQFIATVGRHPKDKEGIEPPFDDIRGRVLEITCFFICCGWMFNLIDRGYSKVTSKNRVIGEGRDPQPGIDHLGSLYINSALENKEHEQFIKRYYQHCNIWSTSGKTLEREKDKLLNQLFTDAVSRRFRKDRGANIIAWTATLLGASVAIIEFVRNIVVNGNENKAALAAVSYTEGALGLIALIITQLTNKKIQTHAKAASSLDELRGWVINEIRTREDQLDDQTQQKSINSTKSKQIHSIFSSKQPLTLSLSSSTIRDMPIKEALIHLNYQLLDIETEGDLYESISKLQLNKQARVNNSIAVLSPNINHHYAALEAGMSSLPSAEAIAQHYDCPIFIVSETLLPSNTYCQLINEHAVIQDDSKEAENPENYKQNRESRHMILYCEKPNYYQPVVAPHDIAFNTIQAQLMNIMPNIGIASTDDAFKHSALNS